MVMIYKVTLRRGMKWLLVVSALTHWNWLANKFLHCELVTSEIAKLSVG